MMISIYPHIKFSAQCPQDNAPLTIKNVVIPGMRCLANATCTVCGTAYYVDLPVGQALWSPVMLNQATADIYDPLDIQWFNRLLKEGFLNPVQSEVVPIVHKFYDADRIIIINCLDFLYGHSLLKLLNVQRYLDHHPDLGCCVLVPTQLKHLVPDGVAEIWEFPVPIKDGWKWHHSLQNWINEQVVKRKECYLSPAYSHPSNRTYDLSRFVQNLPDISSQISQHHPIILFNYREDRLWGKTLKFQQRNLQKLYNQLEVIFPEMAFVLVGFGQQNTLKENHAKVFDLTTNKFSVEQDRLWLAYMSVADCAIGIHGSNMLLPSGLAKSTVELVPRSRLGNTVQDFLFGSHPQDCRDALLNYRMLYGDETLSNIQPSTVADLISTCVSMSIMNSAWFKFGEEQEILDFHKIQQKSVFKQAFNYLQSPRAKTFGQKIKAKILNSFSS